MKKIDIFMKFHKKIVNESLKNILFYVSAYYNKHDFFSVRFILKLITTKHGNVLHY